MVLPVTLGVCASSRGKNWTVGRVDADDGSLNGDASRGVICLQSGYVCECKGSVTTSGVIGDNLGEGDAAGVQEGKRAWVAGDAGEARRALLHISHRRGFVRLREGRISR